MSYNYFSNAQWASDQDKESNSVRRADDLVSPKRDKVLTKRVSQASYEKPNHLLERHLISFTSAPEDFN